MSLRFYFGPSGSGKSHKLYEEILDRAQADLRKNYFIIVPDQFTMQTQMDLVNLSKQRGIMNIDVLSFSRLSHRILEEVGWSQVPILDDTGKSLVLQRVASGMEEKLPALGSLLKRQGYIHEAKSAISEFMQYGIAPKDVSKLIDYAKGRGALVEKLKDLGVLYQGFVDYIQGNFITTEERLDVLSRSLEKSKLLPGSVVVLDGFTGFTPIQNRLIQKLMQICEEVCVTITLGEGEDPYTMDGEQKLFHLSKKTVADLDRLAKECSVPRSEDVFLKLEDGKHRFSQAPALAHLEQHLFRYPMVSYNGQQESVRLFEAITPREEVHQTGLEIHRLIREQGLHYRDIALVVGDMESYAPCVETEFARMDIPCFLDHSRKLVLNPMIEFIQSALELYEQDFSYASVFHFLRSGLGDLELADVDELENYCIQTGVRGKKKWSRLFTRKTANMKEDEAKLAHINEIRQSFYEQVKVFDGMSKATAKEYVEKLYTFLEQNNVQYKLDIYAQKFKLENNLSKAKEFEQIYRLMMELLEQIYNLLGEEELTLVEFKDILEAGFGEMKVGIIPQNVDRVTVGDIERTRLKQVKVLFFLGVNDGNIPKSTSKGGIISDMDREFLRQSELELAPSPRQQMYIQRLYLYLNMTKPSDRLYLSYAKINSAGKSIRPAYLIEMLQSLFPCLKVEIPQNRPVLEQLVTPVQGKEFLAKSLREYANGTSESLDEFFTIYKVYGQLDEGETLDYLQKAAFKHYTASGLSKLVAQLLYGKEMQNSVTRLETFAACAYRHFLQYGLSLRERKEFGFESVDMGNVYHAVLENFGNKLREADKTWFDFTKVFATEAVSQALEAYAAEYGDTVLYSSARNEYAITRMKRVLTRTVLTLQEQLKQGSFVPENYEMTFQFANDLASVHIALSDEEKMHLQGKIDRMDVTEDENHVYVKVVDYKSSDKKFDLLAVYYGLQLQLVVYMNAAMEQQARKHPDKEIVPAAMLYYHIDDPIVESQDEMTPEEVEDKIQKALRNEGMVNADMDIVKMLDNQLTKNSNVIPVNINKDGSFSKNSNVMTREQFELVSDYAGRKIAEIGRSMLDGCIEVNPYATKDKEACTYCKFKKVCGFDAAINGYVKRELEEMDAETIFEQMKE